MAVFDIFKASSFWLTVVSLGKSTSSTVIQMIFIIFKGFITVHNACTLQTGSHNIAAKLT